MKQKRRERPRGRNFNSRRRPQNAPEGYTTLEKVFAKLQHIDQARAALHWDMAVTMPAGGAEARGEQLATLASLHHAILTDTGIGDLLEESQQNNKNLNDWQAANLRQMRRMYRHAVAVPSALQSALVREGAQCEMLWRTARKENDFKSFAPALQNVVNKVREVAAVKAAAFGCSPYEALLDQYDEGRKEADLDALFKDLKAFLPEFIKEVLEAEGKREKAVALKGPFPADKQRALTRELVELLGFDFNKGRLDESHHPFCGGYLNDIRITTRYEEENFLPALMGVVHEAGHAMYEAGLPERWRYQPVGQAGGMALHESQSLLLEMQVGRSRAFLNFACPIIKKQLGGKGKGWSAENLYRLYTQVQPSLIRVDADEVTYPAHIVLRYYLEKYLVGGDMEVADLPEAWRQGMEKFLGVTPENDKDGCMQDIHWTEGSFGYFPTYTLGAIAAAQLFQKATEEDAGIVPGIEKGEFTPLRNWLNQNVHSRGCRYTSDELLEKVTGRKLDVDAYKAHLRRRYVEDN